MPWQWHELGGQIMLAAVRAVFQFAIILNLLASTAVLSVSGAEKVAPTAGKSESAYWLKQNSEIQGLTELIVSKNGVRLELKDRHIVICLRPPLWNVQYCGLQSNRYFECSQQTFKEPLANTVGLSKPSASGHLKVVSSKKAVHAGLPCLEFALIDPFPSAHESGRNWERLSIRSAKAWGLDLGPEASDAGRTISRIYAMPELGSVPLAVNLTNYSDHTFSELETLSAKKVMVNSAQFSAPKGFVKVFKVTDVSLENTVDSGVVDLMQ